MATTLLSIRSIGLAMLAMGIAAPAIAATTYSVTPVNTTVNGYQGYAYVNALGATGAMVGQIGFGVVVNSPALWSNTGQYTDLTPGLYGGPSSYYAIGVDRAERVALYAADAPYLWTNGTLTPLDFGIDFLTMITMSDVGQILSSTTTGASVWTNGVVTTRVSGITPYDINNKGDITGSRNPTGTGVQATLWSNGTFTDLGVLPGDTTSAGYSINDAKHLVGTSSSSSQVRAFFWKDGVMTALVGYAGSNNVTPIAINNSDQIVGSVYFGSGVYEPLIWDNGVVTNLSAVVGQYGDQCPPRGINDAGQIAVCGYLLTPLATGADIGVAIKPSAASVVVGDSLTYNLKVTNAGAEPVTNAMLTDTIPAGTSFVSVVPSVGSCNGSSPVVCTLGDFAPGASTNVQLIVKATASGTLINNANVTINETDVNAVNDNAKVYVTATAPTADIGVTMTDSPDPVKRGSNLTYAIVVKNSGPGNASGVVTSDTLPSSMSFVSARSTQGSCSGTTTVTCTLGSLANGASSTVTIVVKPGTRGTFSNTASITSSSSDTNTVNNSATVTTQVQ